MANKPNNDASCNLFGIPKEWEEISVMFASLLQKEIVENMKGSSNFSSPEKISLYSEEWKSVWEKIENRIGKETMKNKEKFAPFPFSGSEGHPFNRNWEEFWKSVMKETQESLNNHIKKFGDYSSNNTDHSSSREGISKIVSENMQKAVDKILALEHLKKNYSEELQDLIKSSISDVQEKTRNPFPNSKPFNKVFEDMFLGSFLQENPAISSFQKFYLLNTKFLRESLKI